MKCSYFKSNWFSKREYVNAVREQLFNQHLHWSGWKMNMFLRKYFTIVKSAIFKPDTWLCIADCCWFFVSWKWCVFKAPKECSVKTSWFFYDFPQTWGDSKTIYFFLKMKLSWKRRKRFMHLLKGIINMIKSRKVCCFPTFLRLT